MKNGFKEMMEFYNDSFESYKAFMSMYYKTFVKPFWDYWCKNDS